MTMCTGFVDLDGRRLNRTSSSFDVGSIDLNLTFFFFCFFLWWESGSVSPYLAMFSSTRISNSFNLECKAGKYEEYELGLMIGGRMLSLFRKLAFNSSKWLTSHTSSLVSPFEIFFYFFHHLQVLHGALGHESNGALCYGWKGNTMGHFGSLAEAGRVPMSVRSADPKNVENINANRHVKYTHM